MPDNAAGCSLGITVSSAIDERLYRALENGILKSCTGQARL